MATPKPNIESLYPLSPMQAGMLSQTLMAPEAGAYVVQTLCTLAGRLDAARFQQAWQCAVQTHEILRTQVVLRPRDTPLQIVREHVVLPWEFQDWRAFSPQEQSARLDRFLEADRRKGMDFSRAPLMRMSLFQTTDATWQLVFTDHHLLMDGWSLFRVLADVMQAYGALGRGETPRLVAPRPYRDFIAWLRRQDPAAAEVFWRPTLQGVTAPPALGIEIAAGAPPGAAPVAGECSQLWSEQETTALQEFGRRHGLTLSTLAQGATALLIARYRREEEVVFGSTVAGRPGDLPGVEAMVGLFINTLPVRVTVPGAEHVGPWLKRLQDRLVELRQYEQTSLVDIQGWTDVPRNQSLFDCLVVFENYPSDTESWQRAEGLEWRDLHTVERTNLPLNFIWMPEERLRLRILYNGARFDREAIERMGRHLHVLLNAIVANADAPLGSLSLLPEEERRRVTVEWNRTRTDYPRDACIHELFAEQARAHPDATALLLASTDGPSERDVRLTYADLDQRSDRLAARLRALGVRPDERVGLCGERSPDLVVVVLGILKAGGAYLPLDPAYPAERLGHMLRDSGARVVWTQRKFAGVLPALDGLTLVLDDEPAQPAALPPGRPTELNPDCLSYVMYTSGSTGTPKGVAVSHRNVVRLVRNTNYARLGPETVTLHFAPISFDASTYELWAALLNGGKVVLVPALTPSAADLGAVIRTYGINSLFMTSELFRVMVDDRVADLANVAQLFTGGDVLPVPQVKRALEKLPRCELYNVYGPTENTTFTTFYPIFGGGRVEPNVPIGRPISNSTVYILDPRLQPMPIGVPGELYTGGEGVAREYLNDAERTARCFVPDPFAGPPARMYRTGDLARWLPDGSVEFLGRVDNQVKIRGFRVETGEIETAMQNCPGVGQVAVVAVPTPGSGRRLVAYVVRAKDPTGAPADPRTALRQRLPEYMIPSQVIEVATLPMTPAGKVDRRKLASQPVPTAANRTATREPQTPEEQRLAAIWMDLLKTKAVGVDDNFFDLGGHSLLAMQFIARVQEQTGVRLTPNVLMYSTLAQLAKTLSDQAAGQKPGARADGSLLKRLAGRLRGKSAEAGQKPAETGS